MIDPENQAENLRDNALINGKSIVCNDNNEIFNLFIIFQVLFSVLYTALLILSPKQSVT